MLKNYNQRGFIWFLFGLTIIITLAPFFKVGFTNADDLANYMSYLGKTTYSECWLYARSAGRFYFLITKPLYSLPYIGDNFLLTKIIQNLSLLLSYSLFAHLIKKIFKSRELAYVLFLLLIMATPISANYFLPFIAYPFYFTFSFSLVLIAILFYNKYVETKNYKFVLISAITFFIAILFYETYLVFLLFLMFYILCQSILENRGFKKLLISKTFYKELIPFVLVVFLYVSLYVAFRAIFKSNGELYAGSSIAKNFSFTNYFTILIELTKTILPLNLYKISQNNIIQNSLLPSGHFDNFFYILQNSKLSSIINAIIQIFLFIYLCLRFEKGISYKKIFLVVFISILLAFSVHSILGIAEKYNAVEYAFIKGYVSSYYSYFFIWLIILLLGYAVIKLFYDFKIIRISLISIFALGLGYLSIITGYTNDHLSRGWEQSQMRFLVIDELIDKGAFANIAQGSLLFAPEMYNSDSLGYVLASQYFRWGNYVKFKSQKDITFVSTPEKFKELTDENPDAKVYRFLKIQTIKNNDFMVVLAEVNKSTINFSGGEDMFMNATCNSASVHYYSATKDFVFMFYPKDVEGGKQMKINNWDLLALNSGYNQVNIKNININESVTSFDFVSDAEIYTERFSISNMINLYTKTINIVGTKEVIFDYSTSFDNEFFIDSTNVFPMSLVPEIDIDTSFSFISLSAIMGLDFISKDKSIQIVVEIRNVNDENVYWCSEKFTNVSVINFTKLIDIDAIKQLQPSTLKFFIWNPESCTFTITKISNASVKAI